MRSADDASPKRWFDGHTPQDHIRDAAHLLARVPPTNSITRRTGYAGPLTTWKE